MRVSIFYLMLLIGCCQLYAHNGFGQALEKKVVIGAENETLNTFLMKLKREANLSLVWSDVGVIKVTLERAERTVKEVLDLVLQNTTLAYQVKDNVIVISEQKKSKIEDEKDSDQKKDSSSENERPLRSFIVTGKITDAATQQPLPGVNVLIKGTARGGASDAEGQYSISANVGETLLFSFIGYKTFETQVSSATSTMNVIMEVEIGVLKEVVVNAGYYDVKIKEKTGSIVKISSNDIQKQPVQNPLAALQGRVAGLEVTQSTGVPGGNFRVRIRGTNSIANGNDPLFIIDGVPYTSTPMSFGETSGNIFLLGTSPLNNINPNDIESIEVLKDADATAIYGSRGSNGVILITTKKGEVGKTKVAINFYTGVGKVGGYFDQLNTKQYVAMRKEAFANDGTIPTVANAKDLLVFDTTRYTDWQKELIGGTSHMTDAQISLSGGEKYTQFLIGTGYHKETTVFPGDNSDRRVTTRVNVTNTTPNKKLKTSISLNYGSTKTNFLNQDLTASALYLPPNAPAIYKEDGELNWALWNPSGSLENPLAYLNRRYESTTNTLIANLESSYFILPNLELKSRFGYTTIDMRAVNLTPISSLAPSLAASSLNTTRFSDSKFQNWMVEPQVNWKPKIGNGQFDMLIGTQFLDQTTEGLAQTATGFTSEALMKNIAAAPDRILGTNYFTQYRYHAVFGRVNYNYKGKYIINITGRRDGSSRFGPGKQFANFGALGGAWIFSEEGFVKNTFKFLSFGKLRASYGITGNDQLKDYEYLDAYTSSGGTYQGIIGLTPVRLSNPDFAWETNKKIEAALEFGFIEDRILTTIGFYRNRSSNQLVGYPLPPTAGFTSIQANFPATVQNAGVEFELTTVNVQRSEFKWSTSINVSVPRNKLIEFKNLELTEYSRSYAVGEPLSISKTYHYTGISPATGLYQFEDVNENGLYDDPYDRTVVRFTGQYFFGGLQNSFSYKGFQLDIFFQFAKQNGRNYFYYKSSAPGFIGNQPDYVLQRWQASGDISDLQRFSRTAAANEAYQVLQASDRSITDASFIRLKNISVAYTLPTKWSSKLSFSNARIFIQGQNLATITNYKGLDPETQGNSLPPLKVITAGVSLMF